MTMRIEPAKARFGFAAAPMVLRNLDYATLGATTTAQSKLMYTTCIGSRVVQGRSMRERWETVRRDLLGWYFWFMGNSLIQSLTMLSLIPMVAPHAKKLLVRNMNPDAGLLNKARWFFLNPAKLWRITSDKQLEQREAHILNAMVKQKNAATPAGRGQIEQMRSLFEQARNIRAKTSAFGFVFNILVLGLGIMQLNIYLTKSSVQKQQAERELQNKAKQRDIAMTQALEPKAPVPPASAPWMMPTAANPYTAAWPVQPWNTPAVPQSPAW